MYILLGYHKNLVTALLFQNYSFLVWHLCLKAGHYLVSAQVRDEKIDYYHVNIEDNTATNNIVMYCKKWGTKTAIKLTGNGLSWGKYGLPRICKEGERHLAKDFELMPLTAILVLHAGPVLFAGLGLVTIPISH